MKLTLEISDEALSALKDQLRVSKVEYDIIVQDCREHGMFEKATVVGQDANGVTQTYKMTRDNQVFGEHDYDSMVASLTLRFDDLPGSIKGSALTKTLLKLGNEPTVQALLGI